MKINKNLTLPALLIASFTTIASADVSDTIKKQFDFDHDGILMVTSV